MRCRSWLRAGPVTGIELPGPPGAPVLGLVVHGDVQPVDEKQWTTPPFAGVIKNGYVHGRGAADDKGPLVDALLAMHALKGASLTQTVRLLVGSDEESGSQDIKTYLSSHAPRSEERRVGKEGRGRAVSSQESN